MTVNVTLCYFILEYHDAFVYLLDGNDLQILTQYSGNSIVLVSNISPELNMDF